MPLSKTITIQALHPCAVDKYEKLWQMVFKLTSTASSSREKSRKFKKNNTDTYLKEGSVLGSSVAIENHLILSSNKVRAFPLQAWSGPEGSRKLRFPDFFTTAQDGGKFVSLRHRPHLPPGNIHGTHL
jgi:hypothetical protein